MEVLIPIDNETFRADLTQPVDLSIPLRDGTHNPTAWYCGPVQFTPVKGEGFIGDVNQGGSVNFRDVYFNPHGHGTHTECVGHISKEPYTINQTLTHFFFPALVISLEPDKMGDDLVIGAEKLLPFVDQVTTVKAIIIRTLPNLETKLEAKYSNTNPPYFDQAFMEVLVKAGVEHFLTDLPSVDREVDAGVLAAHHAFWLYPRQTRTQATITEMIFVPDAVKDGLYLLNLQIAPFENDAAPSKPVIYALHKTATL